MEAYKKISFDGNEVELNESEFLKVLKEQMFGGIVMSALLNHSKQKIMYEAEYESFEELDKIILETIKFVENTKNYQYGNKYRPELTSSKKKVLKKLNKLLNKEVA